MLKTLERSELGFLLLYLEILSFLIEHCKGFLPHLKRKISILVRYFHEHRAIREPVRYEILQYVSFTCKQICCLSYGWFSVDLDEYT